MSQFTNIRTVSVPSIGKIALADKPGSFTPSGVSRAHRAGRLATDGGFTESATPAKLDLNLNLVAGMDVDALKEIVDEDVAFEPQHIHGQLAQIAVPVGPVMLVDVGLS